MAEYIRNELIRDAADYDEYKVYIDTRAERRAAQIKSAQNKIKIQAAEAEAASIAAELKLQQATEMKSDFEKDKVEAEKADLMTKINTAKLALDTVTDTEAKAKISEKIKTYENALVELL